MNTAVDIEAMELARREWEALKAEIQERVRLIDGITPWQATEPQWWLAMMQTQRAAQSV
jgi:hypothetical protein